MFFVCMQSSMMNECVKTNVFSMHEREVYIALLIEHIEEENARIEEEKAKYG